MLSDHERRELELIEAGLSADPRFVAAFSVRSGAHRRRVRWLVRLMIGCGVLLASAGLLLPSTALVVEGLTITVAGLAWRRWRARRTGVVPRTTKPEDAGPGHGRSRPEWFWRV